MTLNIDVSMEYQVEQNASALLVLAAAQTQGQTVLESHLDVANATLRWIDDSDTPGRRVWVDVRGDVLRLTYRAKVQVTRPEITLDPLAATPFHALPGDVIDFLRPSRFCPSDLFTSFAAKQFGHLEGGAKIAALRDWTARTIVYVPGSSTAATTAVETFVNREGVCRDFAHLVCSLARAAHIPARYTSGYGPDVTPPDFHAVAEVWLDGAWHLVDATGMSSSGDFVVIGTGRDAGDISFMETEGAAQPNRLTIKVSRR
ncbi:MAG: transglutaminase family protein [Rhodobacterales bacterium]|nr:transglutaminase family protein [Rhodobacterales bacterium]